ncbi:hypothetical protein OROGR_006050 [Orobanche gracilis]
MSSSNRRISRRGRIISLCSSDGETIMVDETVAKVSIKLKSIIENNYDGHVINLPGIKGRILSKVVEYCKAHAAPDVSPEELKAFDDEFIQQVEPGVLFGLVLACASSTLNISALQRLTQKGVSNLMNKKSDDEMRRIFTSVRSYNESSGSIKRKKSS